MRHDDNKKIQALISRHRARAVGHQVTIGVRCENLFSLFENRIALSVSETALALGVSVRTIERILSRGEIAGKRVGRRIIIAKTDIESWLSRKESHEKRN